MLLAIVALAVFVVAVVVRIDSLRMEQQRDWMAQALGHVRELATTESDNAQEGQS